MKLTTVPLPGIVEFRLGEILLVRKVLNLFTRILEMIL